MPQEVKELIYESVLGGQLIHICVDPKKPKYSFTHYLCQAEYSEKEAERTFAASTEPWFSTDIESRHVTCDPPSFRDRCFRCDKKNEIATESYAQLSLAFLRCCRQMYQEARSVVFSKSTFSFTDSNDPVLFFSGSRSHIRFAICSLHLDLIVRYISDEQRWNRALVNISKDFKSLQHVYMNIDQHPKEVEYLTQWKFKQPAECSFLRRLRTLRHLKLKTVTIIISDCHCDRMSTEGEAGISHRWTMMQKQEWAEYIRRVILHQKGQKSANGQAV